MKLTKTLFALSLLFLLVAGMTGSTLFAQESSTVITVGVPDWVTSNVEETVFDDFEAENPGIDVVMVPVSSDLVYSTPPEFDVEGHLETFGQYAATADVLFVTSFNLSVAATRAGYILDLSPLVNTDSTLDVNDFYPAMWESLQWDDAIWGMPISGGFEALIYNVDTFDEAGLPYPTGDWTFADFADTARALTQYDEDGDVSLPGFLSYNPTSLIRSFLTQGFYDPNTVPSAPYFSDPELAQLLDDWIALEEEGVIGSFNGEQDWDTNEVPMTVEQPYRVVFEGIETDTIAASLLPGNTATLAVNGFAVSSGTTQPELAYELIKHITGNINIVGMFFDLVPARQSLLGATMEDSNFGLPDYSDEFEALRDEAMLNALPFSETRFSGYINQALSRMREEDIDAASALQELEAEAVEHLQTAEEQGTTTAVFVATPVPTPVLSSEEIALKFGLNMFTGSLPNEEQWDEFLEEFAANDPAVGFVELDMGFADIVELSEENDCFYLPYNGISENNLARILPLDPFLDADPTFDENDVSPGILPQLQRNGMTYALPLVLQPSVLQYNSDLFAEAGVLEPSNGWTVSDFEDALFNLRVDPDDDAPFQPSFGGDYILLLVAAYGAMPIDFSQNPPPVNFNDPATVEAVQQVLDLARDGYIDYQELGSFIGGGGGSFGTAPIYSDTLTPFSFQFFDEESENPYRMTTYPTGSVYTPVSYAIGTAYISATAQDSEACYRFLSELAMRPELFGGMPARQSLLSDPAYTATQTEDALAFYESYNQLLQDPNLLVIPSQFGGNTDSFLGVFLLQLWLYRAFDAYVLEDADLQTVLDDAQLKATSFIECTADIPSVNIAELETQEEQIEAFRPYAECGVLIDPELEALFNTILGDDE